MAKLVRFESLFPAEQRRLYRQEAIVPMFNPIDYAILLNRLVYKYHLEKKRPFKYSPLFKKKIKGRILLMNIPGMKGNVIEFS